MREFFAVFFALAMLFTSVACGPLDSLVQSDFTGSETTLDNIEDIVSQDVEDTISALNEEYGNLVEDIDTYNKYLDNVDKVEEFYEKVYEDTEQLCIRLREYSVKYAELLLATGDSSDDLYDEFDAIYDCIYEDAGDEVYDEIYNGILDDIYDAFYDGILDDAYDDVPYREWSDVISDEYDRWSDTSSDVYDVWSDFSSDIYDFWSDMSRELWDDDIDEVKEVIANFKEDIEKLKD